MDINIDSHFIYFIMGTSGSGKTTILKNIIDHLPMIKYLPSYTTRPLRDGEIDGQKYHFITTEVFEQGIQNRRRLEYAHTRKQAYRYGTDQGEIWNIRNEGYSVIKEIDIIGLKQVLETPIAKHVISIFLSVTEETMIQRLGQRGDMSPNQIKIVVDVGQEEIAYAHTYCNHIVDANQNVEEVIDQVYQILLKYNS